MKAKNPPASSFLAVGSTNPEFERFSQVPRWPAPELIPVQQHPKFWPQVLTPREYTRIPASGNEN
jgi:hypothetical protein